jgi:hypothetical protein
VTRPRIEPTFSDPALETEQSANPLSQFDNSQKVGTLGSIYVSHFNKLSNVHQLYINLKYQVDMSKWITNIIEHICSI